MRIVAVAALVLAVGLAGCGQPTPQDDADTDGDGLFDAEETRGWSIEVKREPGNASVAVTSDPNAKDTDGDGLEDRYEFLLAADARDVDTDDDGLTDCQETRHTVRSECENPSFAAVTDKGTRSLVSRWDTDGDGLSDGTEFVGFMATSPGGGFHLVKTDPLRADSDGDALADGLEQMQFRTDPTAADTDGDGCGDGRDGLPTIVETFSVRIDDLDIAQAGRIRIKAVLSGNNTVSAAIDAVAGPNDVSGLAVPAVRPDGCQTSPMAPWISVAVLVERVDDPGAGGLVDTYSNNPRSSVQAYWNPTTQAWSWDSLGRDARLLPLAWSGTDGTLTFTPLLLPAQAT